MKNQNVPTSMAYSNETPWHKKGKKIQNAGDMSEVLKEAGLDFTVEKVPLYVKRNGGSMIVIELKNNFGVQRTDTSEVLGVVGSRYNVIQNFDGFKPFESLCGKGGAVYETAGVIGSGEKVWVLAKLPGNIILPGNDVTEKFLLFMNSHDGSTHAKLAITPIRVCCQNMLQLAIRTAEVSLSIPHTASSKDRLERAAETLGLVNKTFEDAKKIFEAMAKHSMDKKQTARFVEALFPIGQTTKQGVRTTETGDLSTRQANRRSHVLELVETPNNQTRAAKGTLWGVYNAAIEYADHAFSTTEDEDKRLRSTWFGGAKALKERAFNQAMVLINR